MPDIRAYMTVWYLGCCTASLGMAGNDLLIAAGGSKIASGMMMAGMIVNVILDPLFI
ncbi:MAG TPA: MATE family efflux transporter, partial [Lentisphaeria bacterium]|nr:MATE family efflux transporter [Lentisphaeria bacterium]